MPDWPRDIDPGLLLRLLRRAQRPGLSRPGQAQRIIARHLGMTARPVLAERLTARGQGVGDADVPIVHVRPPAAPAAAAGPAAPPPVAPPVVHLTERVQVPVLQRTVVQAPEAASPPGGRGQQAADGLLRRDAEHERGTPQTVSIGASPQAADQTAERPSSRPAETVPAGQTAPAAQAAPAPQAASVLAALPSLRSWELQPSARSPGRADGMPPDVAAAAVLPLARGRPAEAGAAATDRPARPSGAAGSESHVRDTAPATLPVVISSRVPPEDAVAVGLPAGVPPATMVASPRAVLPVVPEQPWPGALSPAVLHRRPPLPLAAGPGAASGAAAQPAARAGSSSAPAVPAAAPVTARNPVLPNGQPVPATPPARAGLDQADIDRLADTVHTRLLRRLAIERERRGGRR
jgi:hypothetical protein